MHTKGMKRTVGAVALSLAVTFGGIVGFAGVAAAWTVGTPSGSVVCNTPGTQKTVAWTVPYSESGKETVTVTPSAGTVSPTSTTFSSGSATFTQTLAGSATGTASVTVHASWTGSTETSTAQGSVNLGKTCVVPTPPPTTVPPPPTTTVPPPVVKPPPPVVTPPPTTTPPPVVVTPTPAPKPVPAPVAAPAPVQPTVVHVTG